MSATMKEFREIYARSGLIISFEDYIKRSLLVVTGTLGAALIVFGFINIAILKLQGLPLVASTFLMSISACGMAAFIVLYYPLHMRNSAKSKIENTLIYTVSYMTVLSSSGASVERIMEGIADAADKGPMKRLSSKFVADIKLLGLDLSGAVRDVGGRSPSTKFTGLLEAIDNVQKTSGDLKSLLGFNYIRILQDKRKQLTNMLNTLTYIGEAFVTLMVVAPILFIVMLTIFTILGGDMGGAQIVQLNLLVFFGMPLFATGFLIMLDTILEVEE